MVAPLSDRLPALARLLCLWSHYSACEELGPHHVTPVINFYHSGELPNRLLTQALWMWTGLYWFRGDAGKFITEELYNFKAI